MYNNLPGGYTGYENHRKQNMAIVLMEEVLMGLDEVRGALDQAVTTLGDIIEDMSPALGRDLLEELEASFFDPLQSRRDALDSLLARLAEAMN